ncbi:MAG: site-2 protease family protein [Chloroflexota bacterium]|nr:site-2 protease family protein [Chloroflexota bacterium]
MLLRYASDPEFLIMVIVAFVVAITIHEAAHALAATWLGDDIPRLQGRLTLNPMRHLDPLGTLMIAIAPFGWGRPVLVNPYRLRFGLNRGMALVALAGPASNVALALALTPVTRQLLGSLTDLIGSTPDVLAARALLVAIELNIVLAVFNLLPIPPLDGFSVLVGVVPQPLADRLNEMRRYGPYLLIGIFLLIWLIPQGTIIISGPAQWVFELLLGA